MCYLYYSCVQCLWVTARAELLSSAQKLKRAQRAQEWTECSPCFGLLLCPSEGMQASLGGWERGTKTQNSLGFADWGRSCLLAWRSLCSGSILGSRSLE